MPSATSRRACELVGRQRQVSADAGGTPGAIFSMLHRAFGDAATEAIFSEASTVESWLRAEAALARAQAAVGELDLELVRLA